jgi:hypothetical protein
MLSESERTTLREIENNLRDDPEFTRSFRAGKAVPSPNHRYQMFAEFAAWAVLLAAALVIVGAHSAAAFVAVGAAALGLASYIERRAPSTPAAPGRPDRPDQPDM